MTEFDKAAELAKMRPLLSHWMRCPCNGEYMPLGSATGMAIVHSQPECQDFIRLPGDEYMFAVRKFWQAEGKQVPTSRPAGNEPGAFQFIK